MTKKQTSNRWLVSLVAVALLSIHFVTEGRGQIHSAPEEAVIAAERPPGVLLQGGACSIPVTDIKAQLGSLQSGSRAVRLEWAVNTQLLPACVTIRAFKVEVALLYDSSTGKITKDASVNVNGAARSATLRVTNVPDAMPSAYQVTITGAPDIGHFMQADSGQGNVVVSSSGLASGFGVLCSGGGFSCNHPISCGVGCRGQSYTPTPTPTLTVKAVWGVDGPFPPCVRINQWNVRVQLTFPGNTVKEKSATVAGTAREAVFAISNAPASSAVVRVTVKPIVTSGLTIRGIKRGAFQ